MKIYIAISMLSSMLCLHVYCAMTEEELKNFLQNEYEKNATAICNKVALADYAYAADVANEDKKEELVQATMESAGFSKDTWKKYFKDLNVDDYKDFQLRRQVKDLKMLGTAALEHHEYFKLSTTKRALKNIYNTAKICPYENRTCDLATNGLSLDPEIMKIMSKSTNLDELVYIWKTWRTATGSKMRNKYQTYVNLSNEAARANGFKDLGDLWRRPYETANFVEILDNIWSQIEPLYLELYEYVGNKLIQRYGDALDVSDGLLPAHVFGNMWAQDWSNLADLVKPFPNASRLDVDSALLQKNFTVLKMFETADDFYRSLGLNSSGPSYDINRGALIEKPTDGRTVVCHPSATDLCDGENFRIKMCTKVTYEDFKIIHHEMGHIQYYQQYAKLPITFRFGANPGFHEAFGDTIALSMSTPKHLEKIGLLEKYEYNDESALNQLMDKSLEKVAALPFLLLIDKWRWDVFSGTVQPAEWNSQWWKYRKQYQKVKSPVARDKYDFDPGAKYHVPANAQYITYFVAQILEFQFYKSLCIASGQYDPNNKHEVPLHSCDFYNSTTAGAKLIAGLSLGSSHHWSDALEAIAGERDLNASALLEYFEPLYEYLQKYNEEEYSKNPKRFRPKKPGKTKSSSVRHDVTLSTLILAMILQLTINFR